MRLVCRSLLIVGLLLRAAVSLGQQAGSPVLIPPPKGEAATSTPWQPPVPIAVPAPTVPAAAAAPSVATSSALPAGAATAKPPEELLPIPAGAVPSNVADEANGSSGVVLEEEPRWYERAFSIVPAPWDTSIELGINGSSGTSDSFSMRTGGAMKRESRFSKLDLSTYYNRTTSGGETTQNNAQFDIRNDWLLDEKSPWTLFAQNSVFYDQFKDFDIQTNIDTGVGYRIYHEKELELITRVGGGTSREFGGEDNRWVPEALFGVEYSQHISKTQKLYGKLDYFPEVDQGSSFRLVADTGWEIVLVQPSNLSLKISATDRYDSTPNGGEPQLVNYSIMLLLKL